jgi:hypothetical protein
MSNTPIKIGYCLSLSGGLAANGQTARLAHQVWQERVNARGGLLGREVELICVDDKSDAATVAGIYQQRERREERDRGRLRDQVPAHDAGRPGSDSSRRARPPRLWRLSSVAASAWRLSRRIPR